MDTKLGTYLELINYGYMDLITNTNNKYCYKKCVSQCYNVYNEITLFKYIVNLIETCKHSVLCSSSNKIVGKPSTTQKSWGPHWEQGFWVGETKLVKSMS